MPAGTLNLDGDNIIEQGATYTLEVTYAPGGSPFNLTAWIGRAQLRNLKADVAGSVVVKTFTVVKTDAVNGVMECRLTATETQAIDSQTNPSGVWDLEIFNSSTTEVRRILQGTWTLSGEVTR